MDVAFVEGLIRLFRQSSLIELDYAEAGGDRLRLVQQPGGTAVSLLEPIPQAASPPPPPTSAALRAAASVTASFHGVFYRGPAPGKPAFVQLGDAVTEGQTLGILEAMKVLNRVEADRDGLITAMPVADGATVAAGATLFTIETVVD